MFFVLGVLVATLVALMVLPAIWHRAVRLTTRRIEAAVPTSIFEIHADKDLQRAGFALNQRRLEIQIETLRDQLMQDARTLEEHRLKAVELGHTLASREVNIAALQDERDALSARLLETQRTLEERVAALADTAVALATREAEQQQMKATLAELRQSLATEEERTTSLSAVLVSREAEMARLSAQLQAQEQAAAEARQAFEAANSEARTQLEAARHKLLAAEAQAAAAPSHEAAQAGARDEDLALVRERLIEIASRIAAGATSTEPKTTAPVQRIEAQPVVDLASSEEATEPHRQAAAS